MLVDPSIITLIGAEPGPIVTIMAGVHGDEVCGILALRSIINQVKIQRGKVHCIFANLPAIARGVRSTQMNLNRAFRPAELLGPEEAQTYERARALELMPYLDESVALLDVHSSTSQDSTPFIICEPHSFLIARKLPFPIRSHGWDAIEPGGTDYYLNRRATPGYGLCIECGSHQDPKAAERAEDSIRNFLAIMNLTDESPRLLTEPQRQIYARSIYHTKVDFRPVREFADFEAVQHRDLIGYDGTEEVRAEFTGVVIFVRKRTGANQEAFILAEEE
ncbi:MAG: succinylglutamate desuccinylase/aspartoacylase family protein [Candidatus Komeilibacteria bacterium]|nr:succinylglutamate desuccinylase/aspartoacylase family protein [Candidatus Komeilibacteria bacterium]